MKAVFADTSFWIALTNQADAAYEKAQAFSLSLGSRKIITSESVLTEYLNYFAGWGPYFRNEASANAHALLLNRLVAVEPHTPEAFLSGLELYRQRLDKGYSLTDCISMQTMRREGLTEALTSDRHFEQEGFRALFRSSTAGH
jgi:predicted nucleic acid-binding protein